MAKYVLGQGQNKAKSCYAGSVSINRYGIFDGLERPRVVDAKHSLNDNDQLFLLGFDPPSSAPVAAELIDIGEMNSGENSSGYYTYKTIALSSRYTRPVPVGDDTGAYTRSNPSPVSNAVLLGPLHHACCVTQDFYPREDVTHIGWYRSLIKSTSNEAIAGDWYLTAVTTNSSGAWDQKLCYIDIVPDWELGDYAVENDNFVPNAYAYAVEIEDTVFAGGSRAIGEGLTVTVVDGSWGVTLETAGEKFHDGIRGWTFTILGDSEGGVDGLAHYYAWYLTDTILQLRDADNNPYPYDGTEAGTGKSFVCYLDPRVLRWSKTGEPESWPLENSVVTRYEVTGVAQIPNQPMLMMCTDAPEIRIFDVSLLGSATFKTSLAISTEFTAYHFTLCGVEGRIRGIDPWRGAIWECDGSAVRDISRPVLMNVWDYLSRDTTKQKNWHACYDPHQKLYAGFVTLATSARYVDFAIMQHTRTGRWFFYWPKDVLCSCPYRDPNTGVQMVFGGTEGLGTSGGTWGRMFTPGHYNEWCYSNTLLSGTITSATATIVTVDNTDDDLNTVGDGLEGRWVLITDANGENEQVACISANTASTFTVNRVYGGASATQLDPVPTNGYLFWIGLIECRWGPKRFVFEDPSVQKQVLDIYARIKGTDDNNPPFIRWYRGVDTGYERQADMSRPDYIDGTNTESWQSKNEPIEKAFKVGMTLYDRSYNGIEIEDISIIFNPLEA